MYLPNPAWQIIAAQQMARRDEMFAQLQMQLPAQQLGPQIAAMTQRHPNLPAGVITGAALGNVQPDALDQIAKRQYEVGAAAEFDIFGGLGRTLKNSTRGAFTTLEGLFEEIILRPIRTGVGVTQGLAVDEAYRQAGQSAWFKGLSKALDPNDSTSLGERLIDPFYSQTQIRPEDRINMGDAVFGQQSTVVTAENAMDDPIAAKYIQQGYSIDQAAVKAQQEYGTPISVLADQEKERLQITHRPSGKTMPISPGRLVAHNFLDPDTQAFNIVSGAVDGAVRLLADPTDRFLRGAKMVNLARNRVITPGKSMRIGTSTEEFVESPAAQELFDLTAQMGPDQFDTIVSIWGRNLGGNPNAGKFYLDLADNMDSGAVKELVREQMDGGLYTHLPFRRKTFGEIQPGRVRSNIAESIAGQGEVGKYSTIPGAISLRSQGGVAKRLFSEMGGTAVDVEDPTSAILGVQKWTNSAGYSADESSGWMYKMAKAFEEGGHHREMMDDGKIVYVSSQQRVVRDMVKDFSGKLNEAGIPEPVTRALTSIYNDLESLRSYFIAQETGRSVYFTGSRFELVGDTKELLASPSAHMINQFTDKAIPLPDPRQVRKAVNTMQLRELPVKMARSRAGAGVDAFADGAAANLADFAIGEVWKPMTLLRLAWPVRVITEEQLRLAGMGYTSAFNHPIQYMGLVLAKGGFMGRHVPGLNPGALDADLYDDALSLLDEHQTVMSSRAQLDLRGGKLAGGTEYATYRTLSREGPAAYLSTLEQVRRNPLTKPIMDALDAAQENGLDLASGRVDWLDEVKDSFFEGELSRYRNRMLRDGDQWEHLLDRTHSDGYVDSVWAHMNSAGGGTFQHHVDHLVDDVEDGYRILSSSGGPVSWENSLYRERGYLPSQAKHLNRPSKIPTWIDDLDTKLASDNIGGSVVERMTATADEAEQATSWMSQNYEELRRAADIAGLEPQFVDELLADLEGLKWGGVSNLRDNVRIRDGLADLRIAAERMPEPLVQTNATGPIAVDPMGNTRFMDPNARIKSLAEEVELLGSERMAGMGNTIPPTGTTAPRRAAKLGLPENGHDLRKSKDGRTHTHYFTRDGYVSAQIQVDLLDDAGTELGEMHLVVSATPTDLGVSGGGDAIGTVRLRPYANADEYADQADHFRLPVRADSDDYLFHGGPMDAPEVLDGHGLTYSPVRALNYGSLTRRNADGTRSTGRIWVYKKTDFPEEAITPNVLDEYGGMKQWGSGEKVNPNIVDIEATMVPTDVQPIGYIELDDVKKYVDDNAGLVEGPTDGMGKTFTERTKRVSKRVDNSELTAVNSKGDVHRIGLYRGTIKKNLADEWAAKFPERAHADGTIKSEWQSKFDQQVLHRLREWSKGQPNADELAEVFKGLPKYEPQARPWTEGAELKIRKIGEPNAIPTAREWQRWVGKDIEELEKVVIARYGKSKVLNTVADNVFGNSTARRLIWNSPLLRGLPIEDLKAMPLEELIRKYKSLTTSDLRKAAPKFEHALRLSPLWLEAPLQSHDRLIPIMLRGLANELSPEEWDEAVNIVRSLGATGEWRQAIGATDGLRSWDKIEQIVRDAVEKMDDDTGRILRRLFDDGGGFGLNTGDSTEDLLSTIWVSMQRNQNLTTSGRVRWSGKEATPAPHSNLVTRKGVKAGLDMIERGNPRHIKQELPQFIIGKHAPDEVLDFYRTGVIGGHDITQVRHPSEFGKIAGKVVYGADPETLPTYVRGPKLPDKTAKDSWDRVMEIMFRHLMSTPTNKLSRSPLFRQAYWRRLAEAMPHMDDTQRSYVIQMAEKSGVKAGRMETWVRNAWRNVFGSTDEGRKSLTQVEAGLARLGRFGKATEGSAFSAVEGIIPDDFDVFESLDNWDRVAKAFAMEETKDVLYDLSRRHDITDMLRNILPFGEAWGELLTTWTRIFYQNPAMVRRLQQGIEGANETGFFYEDPVTSDTVFNYPGSGMLSSFLFGENSGEEPLDTEARLTGRAEGVNLLSAGLMPGFGPVVQIPSSYLFKDFFENPDHEFVTDLVMPYGTSETDSFLPSWFRKALTAVGGGSAENKRVFANTVMDVYKALAQGEQTRGTLTADRQWQLMEEARSKAKSIYWIRTIGQFSAPTSPAVQFTTYDESGKAWLFGSLAAEWQRMLATNDYEESKTFNEFTDRFGLDPTLYATSKTVSVRRRSITATGLSWQMNNEDLFDESQYSGTAYFASPDDPFEEFDYTAYGRQLEEKARMGLSPEQWLRERNDFLGRVSYERHRQMLNGRTDDFARGYLRQLRFQLMDEYPGYNVANPGVPQVARRDDLIRELEQWVNEPRLIETEAGQGVRRYMEARERALWEASLMGVSPGGFASADATTGLRQYLHYQGQYLSTVYPDFGAVFNQVLRSEVESSEETTYGIGGWDG